MPFVFDFDTSTHAHPWSSRTFWWKGANLAEMTSVLALPVPPGFTISTDACGSTWTGDGPRASTTRWPGPGPASRRPWTR